MKITDAETLCEDIRRDIAKFNEETERTTHSFGGPGVDAYLSLTALTQLIAVAHAGKLLRDTYVGNDPPCDELCVHVDCSVIHLFDSAFNKMEKS